MHCARDNVAWAADRRPPWARRSDEELNSADNGPCLLTTTAAAASFIGQVGRGNVRLQYNAYHMQRMEGDLTATLDAYWELISHIQIAECRAGRARYRRDHSRFFLEHLRWPGYPGYVGLETGQRRAGPRTPSAGSRRTAGPGGK